MKGVQAEIGGPIQHPSWPASSPDTVLSSRVHRSAGSAHNSVSSKSWHQAAVSDLLAGTQSAQEERASDGIKNQYEAPPQYAMQRRLSKTKAIKRKQSKKPLLGCSIVLP